MNITYTDIKNPKWLDVAQTAIQCEVNFTHLPEEYVEFTCRDDANDLPHVKEIFDRCVAGDFGTVELCVPNAPIAITDITDEELVSNIRLMRNTMLQEEVDPVTSNPLRWNALSEAEQQAWTAYRQALLDLPESTTATYEWDDNKYSYELKNLPTKPE